jgi:hypothetical protein
LLNINGLEEGGRSGVRASSKQQAPEAKVDLRSTRHTK